MTGVDLLAYLSEKVQQSWSGILETAPTNRLIQQALYQAIENKYRGLAEQRQFDNITSVIKTEQLVVPVANQVTLTVGTGLIPDYNHLLSLRAKFTAPLYVTLSGATNASPIVITTNKRNNIRTGDNIEISGVIGNTAANGVFFPVKISDFRYQLFSDAAHQVPVVGNGAYISGGTISRVYYNGARIYRSDEKIGTLATPTVDYPKFETVQNVIKLYPSNQVCQEITVDYITTLAVIPDVTDNVIDLELTYSYQFLMYLVSVAAEIFSGEVKDREQQQTQEVDLAQER